MKGWFEVDKAGLAQLLERRGKGFILLELIQNAWDQNVTTVDVRIGRGTAERTVQVRVEDDDPEGFADLAHAFTLFAASTKKSRPEKRGRFNLGEKLVLAVCEWANIMTTKGEIEFDENGRHAKRGRTQRGSIFTGRIRMTREEEAEAVRMVHSLIPPEGIETCFNGSYLTHRTAVATFEAALPTEIADAEGAVRRTTRKCRVEVYEPNPGEVPSIYELGIPVVETGDRFHVNVLQKVPLNMDRDNVPPAYLQQVRTLVLNTTRDLLTEQDVTTGWARSGADDPRCEPETMKRLLDLRFGEKRVAADPSDPEANKRAAAAGYTVVPGGAMGAQEWVNAKRAALVPPAGQVFPTPKPFCPDGRPVKLLPEKNWTPGISRVHQYGARIAQRLIGHAVAVEIANDPGWSTAACYGPGNGLYLNVARLGRAWFEPDNETEIDRLLIHELAHEFSDDHLSDEYHGACCRLGARLKRLALNELEVCRL
ncbi:MAG: hypothetical protein AMXMBFR13_42270 [Phycisphaerae bacterium]